MVEDLEFFSEKPSGSNNVPNCPLQSREILKDPWSHFGEKAKNHKRIKDFSSQ